LFVFICVDVGDPVLQEGRVGIPLKTKGESLNSLGKQFHQYQQKEQLPLTSNLNSQNTKKKDHGIWRWNPDQCIACYLPWQNM
jgi:hypothetical protein